MIDGRRRLAALGGFMLEIRRAERAGIPDRTRGRRLRRSGPAQKRRLGETLVTLEIVKTGTPSAIRRNIFHRVNPRRSPQEVRDGGRAWRSNGAARLAGRRRGLSRRDRDRRGRRDDREAVLRFLAVLSDRPSAGPRPAARRRADGGAGSPQRGPGRHAAPAPLAQRFEAAMALLARAFDGRACRAGDGAGPLDPALFETWSVMLARLDSREGERLLARRKRLSKRSPNCSTIRPSPRTAACAPGSTIPPAWLRGLPPSMIWWSNS